jgi:hypothetical protein
MFSRGWRASMALRCCRALGIPLQNGRKRPVSGEVSERERAQQARKRLSPPPVGMNLVARRDTIPIKHAYSARPLRKRPFCNGSRLTAPSTWEMLRVRAEGELTYHVDTCRRGDRAGPGRCGRKAGNHDVRCRRLHHYDTRRRHVRITGWVKPWSATLLMSRGRIHAKGWQAPTTVDVQPNGDFTVTVSLERGENDLRFSAAHSGIRRGEILVAVTRH